MDKERGLKLTQDTQIIIFTVTILVIFIGLLAWISFSVWKERGHFYISWGQLNLFQKWSIKFGLLIFFFMPILSKHPAKDEYLPKVLSELLYEAGKALFMFGMISLLQFLCLEQQAKKNNGVTTSVFENKSETNMESQQES